MPTEIADPIFDLLEEFGGIDIVDDYLTHLISLSDIVKNDMRKFHEWDDATVHAKLWSIINDGLDKNGRYRERSVEKSAEKTQKFSSAYVDTQCLLTEWLNIYRVMRPYCHFLKKAAKTAAAA